MTTVHLSTISGCYVIFRQRDEFNAIIIPFKLRSIFKPNTGGNWSRSTILFWFVAHFFSCCCCWLVRNIGNRCKLKCTNKFILERFFFIIFCCLSSILRKCMQQRIEYHTMISILMKYEREQNDTHCARIQLKIKVHFVGQKTPMSVFCYSIWMQTICCLA